MKKRLENKLRKQSKIKINKIKPKEGEIVVFEFDRHVDMRAAKSIFQGVKKTLTDNKVIAVPQQGAKISLKTKEELLEMINNLEVFEDK